MRYLGYGLGLVVALALLETQAHAEPPRKENDALAAEKERAAARALADRGYELYQAGKFEEAKKYFYEANQRYKAPTLLLMMARCHEKQGQLRRAFEIYRQMVRQRHLPNAPKPFHEARAQAIEALAAIQERMPAVKVFILGLPRRDAWIMVDDIAAASGERVPLDPGRHSITVDAYGLPTARTIVEVTGTATTIVEITLGKRPRFVARVEAAKPAESSAPAAAKDSSTRPRDQPGPAPAPKAPAAAKPTR